MPVSAFAFVLTIENVDFFVDNDFVDLIDTAAATDTILIYSNFRFIGKLDSKPTTSKNKKAIFFLNPFKSSGSN